MRLLFVLVAIPLVFGCAPRIVDPEWGAQKEQISWPDASSVPRIDFLRTFQGSADFQDKKGKVGTFLDKVTGERQVNVPLVSPYGIAVNGQGGIWVTDPGSGYVHYFDLAKHLASSWSIVEETRLVSPAGILYDKDRARLYLSDAVLKKIFILNEDFSQVAVVSHPLLERPAGMGIDSDGNLYVADVLAHKVFVFSDDGALLRSYDRQSPPHSTYNRPLEVSVNAQNHIFVLDSFNFQIEHLMPDGLPVALIGGLGAGPGSFIRPRGLALDPDGHVYVSDADLDRIQIFNEQGQLLLVFSGPGAGPGELKLPAGMTFDQLGRLYVVDSHNQRIQIFKYVPE